MSTATPTKLYKPDDLLTMPDDGVERWLVGGELREAPTESVELGMTVRNRFHSEMLINVGTVLKNWVKSQPEPRGKVYGGEAGVILPGDPQETVGVDVVYAASPLVEVQNDETTLFAGVPTLAVEITSPGEVRERADEKIESYLAAGVPTVWVVDPRWRTVAVFHPGREPESFNVTQSLPADPNLPGLTVSVVSLFE
jgi:Uma2 family endonuclease